MREKNRKLGDVRCLNTREWTYPIVTVVWPIEHTPEEMGMGMGMAMAMAMAMAMEIDGEGKKLKWRGNRM